VELLLEQQQARAPRALERIRANTVHI